ncbi:MULTISPECIES: hypothetical protein [unclassified Microbacterium]|uniref:hypothetical protein n=1 Tax=unclassified Microbacterium TaxID=2609290 RepID=UPI003652F61B
MGLMFACFLAAGLVFLLIEGGEWLMEWIPERRKQHRMAIEAELDRKQEELRATIFQLASALSMDAHDARRELVRTSYLATGTVPDDDR